MRTASIIDYIPEGKENAVTRERLCAITGLPDRKLREEIEQARRRGAIIINAQDGIDTENSGFWLYAPNTDGSSPITDRIEEWISRSGEKAQLKRRIQELEQENAVLRSLIQK